MRFQVNVVVTVFGLWSASAAVCHAQATFEAQRLSPLEMKAEIEEQNRRLREASVKFKQPIETGISLFGKNKSQKAMEYGKPYSGSPLDTRLCRKTGLAFNRRFRAKHWLTSGLRQGRHDNDST